MGQVPQVGNKRVDLGDLEDAPVWLSIVYCLAIFFTQWNWTHITTGHLVHLMGLLLSSKLTALVAEPLTFDLKAKTLEFEIYYNFIRFSKSGR